MKISIICFNILIYVNANLLTIVNNSSDMNIIIVIILIIKIVIVVLEYKIDLSRLIVTELDNNNKISDKVSIKKFF